MKLVGRYLNSDARYQRDNLYGFDRFEQFLIPIIKKGNYEADYKLFHPLKYQVENNNYEGFKVYFFDVSALKQIRMNIINYIAPLIDKVILNPPAADEEFLMIHESETDGYFRRYQETNGKRFIIDWNTEDGKILHEWHMDLENIDKEINSNGGLYILWHKT